MIKWAEREVEIACKKEAPDRKENEWDYGCACYESALKAYKSLCEDGHSGFSWRVTRDILIRLMDHLPLTQITDEDFFSSNSSPMPGDEDGEYLKQRGLRSVKQCPRMSSLFRYEYLDGRIEYKDVERCYCYNKDDPTDCWSNGLMAEQLDKMFPITMPYYPSAGRYKLECSEALSDPKNGDFDTLALWSITTPKGEKIEVNKFWKESRNGWIKIDDYEWLCRSGAIQASNVNIKEDAPESTVNNPDAPCISVTSL